MPDFLKIAGDGRKTRDRAHMFVDECGDFKAIFFSVGPVFCVFYH
jgi:hypothetical protein